MAAPTMFPRVTGTRFPKMNWLQVMLAPASIPCGMMNMLATECSKPRQIKVEIGNQMAPSLPMIVLLAIAHQTARHTSQLHRMPFAKATPNGKVAWWQGANIC
eukprot:scaffold1431_cov328-Prasinococcus_capsulatus_cf.AAC.2